jgi:hypothetical protein
MQHKPEKTLQGRGTETFVLRKWMRINRLHIGICSILVNNVLPLFHFLKFMYMNIILLTLIYLLVNINA